MAKFGIGVRVIDLLGRQQVAGTPTAISELFKNAHDAYAQNVEADFYRLRDLFILRDDGVGMSREDFETRWLTAATDSKRDTGFIKPPEVDPDQSVRPVMGEKGIGRLSIAVLGKQVLVLTRRKTSDSSAPIIAALLHWNVFSLPNINLGDLDIPVRELPPGVLPDRTCVKGMVDEATTNLSSLRARTDASKVDEILGDLALFDIDPAALAPALVKGPDLRGDGHGTHFYITPTHDALALDIDSGSEREKATPMEKALLGFSNTMVPGHVPPPMTTRFRDHGKNGLWRDLIAEDQFFTPEEFESADHRITGQFDLRGQFSGFVKMYGKEPTPIQIRWPDADGKDTRCGPFRIDFAYVQGSQSDSRLPPDLWGPMIEKLNRIGGLYIYRDGMRVLPYGDSDYDFLDIESRRSRKASYYFFSYRRMFGVIDITRRENSNLIEKAGREGFQENSAYKQFKNILANFFIQLAAEFFREGGVSGDEYLAEKGRLNRMHKLLEKRQKQISGKRRKFKNDLDTFFGQANVRGADTEVTAILDQLRRRLKQETATSITLTDLRQIEKDAGDAIHAIDDRSRIIKPRGVGLTKEQSLLWARYEVERDRLVSEVFQPAHVELQRLVQEAANKHGLALEMRRHAAETLAGLGTRSTKQVRSLATGITETAKSLQERVIETARESVRVVATAVEEKLIEFEHQADADLSDDDLLKVQARLEAAIEAITSEHKSILAQLSDQLSRAGTDEARESEEILEALESELEEHRERELESLQLAQMGQAIGIVHHEFHSVIRSVRTNVRRLAPWAERNQKLADLYRDISESYAHLDSYLSLFAPLNRRLSQVKRLIKGEEVSNYLNQLLGDRLRRHGVELVTTKSFREATVNEYVATLYPSFVNIVDNALFWVNHGDGVVRQGGNAPSRPKKITLDFEDGAFSVSDTGPGVLPADEAAIFETGFSRKPKGSGLGLHITRNLLERNNYQLTVDPYRPGAGATFRIHVPTSAIPEE